MPLLVHRCTLFVRVHLAGRILLAAAYQSVVLADCEVQNWKSEIYLYDIQCMYQ